MLGSLLTRLYAHLLYLYPDRFVDEFGGEMVDLFARVLSGLDESSASPAARRVKMAGLFSCAAHGPATDHGASRRSDRSRDPDRVSFAEDVADVHATA